MRHLQFTSLRFGISSAPHTFTKVVISVVAGLRDTGITIVSYLLESQFFSGLNKTSGSNICSHLVPGI